MSQIPAPPPPPSPAAAAGTRPLGKCRSPVSVILLSIITLGIYYLVWTYKTFQEMKEYSGEGIGGGVGLVIGLFVGIVNWFLIPAEAGNLYGREGKQKPVSGVTGFWNLIPLLGFILWVVMVQGALNEFWKAHGATS